MNKIVIKNLERLLDEEKEIQIITNMDSRSIFKSDVNPEDIISTLDIPEDYSEDIPVDDTIQSFDELNSKFENDITLSSPDKDIIIKLIESLPNDEIMYLKKFENIYKYVIDGKN